MAKLSEFGGNGYKNLTDYKIEEETIDTLLGLLAFPVVEETILDDGLTINVFEKSFWGKKHKGHITLRYIEDAKLDSNLTDNKEKISEMEEFNSRYYNKDSAPKSSNILIGIDFSSELKQYYSSAICRTYQLGTARKEILNYSFLIYNLDCMYSANSKIALDAIKSFNHTKQKLSLDTCNAISQVTDKVKKFQKFIV